MLFRSTFESNAARILKEKYPIMYKMDEEYEVENKMCIKRETPCDFGECPYNAEYSRDCEYWCGAEEPEEDYDFDDDDIEVGFNPYMGEYDYDC